MKIHSSVSLKFLRAFPLQISHAIPLKSQKFSIVIYKGIAIFNSIAEET